MNLDQNGANLRSEVPGRGCATNGLVHEPPLLRPTIRIASAPVVRRQQDTASPSFSTDESRTGAVRTHVVMLTPMHRPCDSTPLTVTFDTNTLASVVAPETAQRGTGESGAIVAAAMRAGRIRGFFSETVITLEGIKNVDRADVLGRLGWFPMPHRPARIISLSRLASGMPEIPSTPDPLTGFGRHWS